MANKGIIRVMAAIIVMLAVGNLSAHAQLGNALKKAKEKAKEVVKETTKEAATTDNNSTIKESVSGAADDAAGVASLTPSQRTAYEKIMDPGKRETTILYVYTPEANAGSGSKLREYLEQMVLASTDSAKQFKEELEARHAENLALTKAVTYDQLKAAFPKNTSSFEGKYRDIEKEIEMYGDIIERYRGDVKRFADISVSNGQATVNRLQVGTMGMTFRNGEPYFTKNVGGKTVVAPADEAMYQAARDRYTNLTWLIRKEPPAEQFPEYSTAQVANQFIFMAQKNSIKEETKQPVPVSQMNNPTLTTKMLKLAQEAYPTWGIVKLIIAESAWRPEHNALGQIIHRRINTKIILPRSAGGHIMRTLSFIEPYNGDGKYGEVRPFGIGTDEVAVDYK